MHPNDLIQVNGMNLWNITCSGTGQPTKEQLCHQSQDTTCQPEASLSFERGQQHCEPADK